MPIIEKTDVLLWTARRNLRTPYGLDAPCFSDILAFDRAIYLLRKFDITSLRFDCDMI